MAIIKYTREARCSDCKHFRSIRVGKRRASRCVQGKPEGSQALADDPAITQRTPACSKFVFKWRDT